MSVRYLPIGAEIRLSHAAMMRHGSFCSYGEAAAHVKAMTAFGTVTLVC